MILTGEEISNQVSMQRIKISLLIGNKLPLILMT